ncbi:unnamed protein product, partial [Porites lobata]
LAKAIRTLVDEDGVVSPVCLHRGLFSVGALDNLDHNLKAEVSSAGTAKSMLNAAHLTRTRHAHQVTLLTLHILQREAFLRCNGSEHKETAEAWRLQMIAKSPTFMGAYFAIRNSYSHLCPGSQGENRSFACERFGRTSTFA